MRRFSVIGMPDGAAHRFTLNLAVARDLLGEAGDEGVNVGVIEGVAQCGLHAGGFRFRPVDVVVGAGVFLLLYAIVRIGAAAHAPIPAGALVKCHAVRGATARFTYSTHETNDSWNRPRRIGIITNGLP